MNKIEQKSVRSVKDYCDHEYRDFAKYTIEKRAIPSVIDGFKPGQRKIAWVASDIWKTGSEKPLKVFQLSGQVAAKAFYAHGDTSLSDTIVGMTQEFKNSMSIFDGVGQFGSLRSPEAGAPRYIGVKFNKNFKHLYKDADLLENKYEDGEKIEPKFFLPIIPTVLLNGTSGIAVGFATNILNRHPLNLINACLDYLEGKQINKNDLVPFIKGFNGIFKQDSSNEKSWSIFGKYSTESNNKICVNEIPPHFTYEKYEEFLNKLIEEEKIISYDDNSSEQIDIQVKLTRVSFDEYTKKGKVYDILSLISKETENFTTLDENGKLKIFNSAQEIVKYFVDFRLTYFQKRKDRIIENIENTLAQLNRRLRFINDVIENKIKINNAKKEFIIQKMIEMEYEKENNSFDYLLSMPIHTLTEEKIIEIKSTIEKKKNELEEIKKQTPHEMYRKDLLLLKKSIS